MKLTPGYMINLVKVRLLNYL
ncbi:hypothetical protein CNEO4_510058 [Clostridium neonatale]|nr:hypothetical protein CNEO3_180024 [Clostridium neonatale]CAI3653032.1 hypothetical protein CNEO3_30085 [Clostridium neonatale]CAI3662956.1 hypothetical protein CNEO4_530056 [Clostridium neonatale]CAI3672076.1 hypothetical protein CNEO4_510058 [Clostridium neonatale]CAI3686034.1 hypothetical protein CNEO4_540055 [Clostridium neonatale]